jgi:hypothetical protein
VHQHTATCCHMLPCAPWLWTQPPCSGGLLRCHVFHGSRSRIPTQEGSGVATCPMATDSASLLGRAPVLPRVSRLRTHLPARDGSGSTTCPAAPDPASLLGRAPALPRVPRPSKGHRP